MARSKPNILVIGTPGTGKSTICQSLAFSGLELITLSEVIKEKKFYDEWDDDYNAAIFDEDKAGDWLDTALEEGGKIVEFHSCNWMDPSWFDAVIVLTVSTNVLYDRLEKRGYPIAKVQENVQAEIFMICKEEAYELMDESHESILVLENNTIEAVESNVQSIMGFLKSRGF